MKNLFVILGLLLISCGDTYNTYILPLSDASADASNIVEGSTDASNIVEASIVDSIIIDSNVDCAALGQMTATQCTHFLRWAYQGNGCYYCTN